MAKRVLKRRNSVASEWSDAKKLVMSIIGTVSAALIIFFLTWLFSRSEESFDPSSTREDTVSLRGGRLPSFTIAGSVDSILRHHVARESGLEFDPASLNSAIISFFHTGHVYAVGSDDLVAFDGGVVTILVNSRVCKELDSLELTSWADPEGNPKALLESELTREIFDLVSNNISYVAREIVICLGKAL
jgi:hypothetical protein